MKGPLVSVIVPVYNVENYLEECLESIIAQTLKNIEIICVNDGSTDRSLEILEFYEKKDSRIVVIDKKNAGYGHTMNVGMDRARGEYIGIVESDDYIKKDMFQYLYNKAVEKKAEIVKSDLYYLYTNNGRKKMIRKNTCPDEFFYDKILSSDEYKEIFDFEMMNWTGIYRRDFIKKNNIRHNETPGASFQDNGFWFQSLALAERIVYVNKAFYYYRQDNPSSSINNKEKVYCICDEFDFIKEFLDKNPNQKDELFTTYIKKKFFNFRHSYERISEKYKMDFLRREQQEYKKDLEELGEKKGKIDSWILGEMNRIIDSPEIYFYECNIGALKEKYKKVHEELIRLRESREWVNGIKIRDKIEVIKGFRK